jgi:head-tail adaptor
MGRISAGNLDKRIRIERDTPSKDGHGNSVSNWALLTLAWAKVFYGLGVDRRQAAADNAAQTATFQIRRNATTQTITPADRVVFRGLNWEINGIAEFDRDDIELTATATKPGGLA